MCVTAHIFNIAGFAILIIVFAVLIVGISAFGVMRGGIFAIFFGLLAQQLLTVADRDLIIIGVNFVKGEETVPVAAIFNEGSL